jgi:hypothetical protein
MKNETVTTKRRGARGKAGNGQRAARAMEEAADLGNLKAAKAIGKSLLALDAVVRQIKDERKHWALRVGAAEAALRGAIESDDDGTEADCRRKLAVIVTAHQEAEEAVAGKKDALSLLLKKRKEAQSRLNQQIEGARQLGLFD